MSKPTFNSQEIFNKNFAAIHEIKPVLVLKKPVYAGFTVLELSKCFMYDFQTILSRQNLMLVYCLLIKTAALMK